jgi:hypothetical protein
MWADIAASKRFCRTWRTRLKRLGLRAMADLQVLGDGASWIWKSADRVLNGCGQTLDIYHACEHVADAGKRLFGEGTAAAAPCSWRRAGTGFAGSSARSTPARIPHRGARCWDR